jgi:hypothetical protein
MFIGTRSAQRLKIYYMSRNKNHLILSPGRLIDESNALELKDALFCPKVGGKALFPEKCGIQDGRIICTNCSNAMNLVASVCLF